MANRNWGLIANGAMFEALATTLVFSEDPKAALFGRRGKDGGQDARSGDGTRVFQAKHHEDESAIKAIADAKKEAAKIAEYRKPGHSRHDQWKGVTHWRLITNAPFNPTDRQKWDTEVVPLFKEQKLAIDYWERANLDGLLDKHPEVDRSYFQNETRVFLTLPEVHERLLLDELFLQRGTPTEFFGRDDEMSQVVDFLSSSALFLLVHGAGGIGKTRLLVEAGEQIASEGTWQVLWANIASMSSSGTWFEAIVPERPTLLFVDEPEDEQLLRVLSEQLGGRVGRTVKWKVAVAVRSPKDPVLRFLFAPKMKARVRELQINALSNTAAEGMCDNLIRSGPHGSRSSEEWIKNATRELARRFSQHPIWLTLAVHVLETQGDLTRVPQTANDLAASYLEEIINLQQQTPREQVLSLLRWVALLDTVNREDDTAIKLLREGSSFATDTDTRKVLADLVNRRVLIQRGAWNRLVELKPDVLRDHILLHWLSVDVGYGDVPIQPSEAAKKLLAQVLDTVLKGSISTLGQSILTALARTETLLRLSDKTVPLLDPFFIGIHSSLPATTASTRIRIAEVIVDIAAFRPVETVSMSRALRCSPVKAETINGLFRSREISHDDVVLELAWPVYHAAMGAQTPDVRQQIIEELCAITEAEADIGSRRSRGLPNDGKRGSQLIGQLLEGGPQFWSDFEDAVTTVALRLLDDITSEPAASTKAAVIKALLKPATELERRQTWNEGNIFHIQNHVVLPDHPAWTTREVILKHTREILAKGSTPTATRIVLWDVFTSSHKSANQSRNRGNDDFRNKLNQELLEDLNWAHKILQGRVSGLEELTAARNLWDWHYRFDKDPSLKLAADKLEALYVNNELAREFEPLLSRDDWDERSARAEAKAKELAAPEKPEIINAFIDRAIGFLGANREIYQILNIAWHLGNHAPTSPAVRTFVRKSLSESESAMTPRIDFAATTAASWIAALRKSGTTSAAFELAIELVNLCSSGDRKTHLIQRVYGGSPPPSDIGKLSSEEHDYLRTTAPLFLSIGKGPYFLQAVGWTLHHDWEGFKTVVERTLDGIPEEQIGHAVNALVEAVYWAIRDIDQTGAPDGLGQWLLDQVLRMPDMDSADDMFHWRINEVLKRVGRLPVTWLPNALKRRRDMETVEGHEKVHALSRHALSSFITTPISPAEVGDKNITKAVSDLVDLVEDSGTIGYYLPNILQTVDPEGFLIPSEIARRFEMAAGDAKWPFARIAGEYTIGTAAWRTIAKPVISCALEASDRRPLFRLLTDQSPKAWSSSIGEVPQLFLENVQSARQFLNSETDAAFRPFWEWYLAIAEADLHEQEEQAKEERGE
jgi:hypothetical protein